MIIKLGKKAKIFFKTGSSMMNQFGLWLEASIMDHSSAIIPEEIRRIYINKKFSDMLMIRDEAGNNFYLPEEDIEEIEYI